jgi:hypothetical protein
MHKTFLSAGVTMVRVKLKLQLLLWLSNFACCAGSGTDDCSPDELLRYAQQAPHLAHLILEQLPERLYQRELQVLGEAAHVVVGLDRVAVLLTAARGWAGLNHIWVPAGSE